jgi:uncharacterized protein YgiM (DUF1202 family)
LPAAGIAQQQQPGGQAANAPIASQRATQPMNVYSGPSATSRVVFNLQPGAQIYPTGQRNGVWMEIDDANGNRGWVNSTQLDTH